MSREQTKRYKIDMCNGPILQKMLLFALPLMLSSILQLLFNAVVSYAAADGTEGPGS